jgi:mannose-6-phosphate isomerase-like protein (cupin superfamily)
VPVKAGDVTIVRPGESHGLANTGKEPLVFVDVIAQA